MTTIRFGRKALTLAALLTAVAAPAFAMGDDGKNAMAPAMAAMESAMSAHPTNGTTDHDFAVTMMAMAKAQQAAAKMEIAKGTNAAAVAAAKKALAQATADYARFADALSKVGP